MKLEPTISEIVFPNGAAIVVEMAMAMKPVKGNVAVMAVTCTVLAVYGNLPSDRI